MSSNKISMIYLLLVLISCTSCDLPSKKSNPELHIVEIKQMQFQPSSITVQKGDTIVFINRDILAHNVTEETSQRWTSSTINTGESYKLPITANANYYCTIHPVMKGKIIIQ